MTPEPPTESPSYVGWTVVQRTLDEYHSHFPGWASKITDALTAALPGASVKHTTFHRSSEEPIVIPPPGASQGELEQVESLAVAAYERATGVCEAEQTDAVPDAQSRTRPSPAVEPPEGSRVNPNTHSSEWLINIPMIHLSVSDTEPINGEWEVGDVRFVSVNQLAKLLQPPTLRTAVRPKLWEKVRDSIDAFAVIRRNGIPNSLRGQIFRDVRHASDILASTAAFYGRRHHSRGFTLKGYPFHTAKQDCFFETNGTAYCGNWNQRGMLFPFELDEAWHKAISDTGIIKLFTRITDPSTDAFWRRQIGSGAAMLGRSLMSLDLADAFLLNVIGLETLLTRQRERNGRMLFQRIKGMTGWHLKTARPEYEDEIKRIHGVRCEIVHDSDYSNLSTELLLQSDMYLANSLLNIVNLPTIFPDKATLASKLDDYAINENWPTDGSVPFRWFGNASFSPQDLQLQLW